MDSDVVTRGVVTGCGLTPCPYKTEEKAPLWRSYHGIIWIGDDPGIRFTIVALSPLDASALVAERWGPGHVVTIIDDYPRRFR